tara:strand:+ start:447 stop:2522 length:2076 start_codon:yes stop_codon:yes gene_type:complete
MKKTFVLIFLNLLINNFLFFNHAVLHSQAEKDDNPNINKFRDIYPDTWVASDGLGRKMPTMDITGPIKKDQKRFTGIFYITWHTEDKVHIEKPYNADVTKILNEDPNARLNAYHKLWSESTYHWGEPEMGYFLSQDKYVIAKDISMLADAGIDVIILDVTNGVCYWDEWEVLFKVMTDLKNKGNKVPKFCFWAFNGEVITVVQNLFQKIYKKNKYDDLWFYWNDKPLLLYNDRPELDANQKGIKKHPNPNFDMQALNDPDHPHFNDPYFTQKFYNDYTDEVKKYFTLRTMWWGYYKWGGKRFIGSEDKWSFGYNLGDPRVKNLPLIELLSTHNGKREQAAVTVAQHPVSMNVFINMGIGKSWSRKRGQPKLNKYDLPESAFVDWLGKKVDNPEGYGIYFQERWDEALEVNPEFIYINDWNEWTAGKYFPDGRGGITRDTTGKSAQWLGRKSPFIFVDQYNAEFNRGIHPMKEGYTDNYYMQMVQNIRKYKGVRPIPINYGYNNVGIDGAFDEWDKIKIEYRDTRGDIIHRDHQGYAGIHYKNNSGRNDIITSKISVSKDFISFYLETDSPLTPHNGKNWMLIFVDIDKNPNTGWYGYDYLLNKEIIDESKSSLMRYEDKKWINQSIISYSFDKNKLEISVPRDQLELLGNELEFDFKVSDNMDEIENPISFCLNGDTAPNRRFNYRFIWKK